MMTSTTDPDPYIFWSIDLITASFIIFTHHLITQTLAVTMELLALSLDDEAGEIVDRSGMRRSSLLLHHTLFQQWPCNKAL